MKEPSKLLERLSAYTPSMANDIQRQKLKYGVLLQNTLDENNKELFKAAREKGLIL